MAEFDLAVIGGGPAGLTAAVYALQAQLQVALISPDLGGKVSYAFQLRGLPPVESAWGVSLTRQLEAYVDAKLTRLIHQPVERLERRPGSGFQITLSDGTIHGARTVIFATGAQPQRLQIPGEQRFLGRGVSYSAVSHAQFFRDRMVAVIGGERALAAAQKLAPIASRVHFVITPTHDMPSSRLAHEVLRHPKIMIHQHWSPQRIVGDEFVTGLELLDGEQQPQTLAVDGVFIEQGLIPNQALVRDWVELDCNGHVMVNQRCETSVPGLFAAGDVTNVHAEQVLVAIGEGAKAALSAWNYLAAHR